MNTITNGKRVIELCPHCEHEVELDAIMFVGQKCPHCGGVVKACSMCDCDVCDCAKCSQKYPEEEQR